MNGSREKEEMSKIEGEKISAVLFDLDGTLVNNYEGIYSCLNETFDKFSIPRRSYQEVVSCVGGSILLTIKKLLGDVPNLNDIGQYYAERFNDHALIGLKPLPYVAEILSALKERGKKIGLLTNKAQDASEIILKHLGFARYFDSICGTTLHSVRKPDVEFTQRALDELGAAAGESLMVGDSQYDYKTAKNISMYSAMVATGATDIDTLRDIAPDALGVFPSMKELAKGVWNMDI